MYDICTAHRLQNAVARLYSNHPPLAVEIYFYVPRSLENRSRRFLFFTGPPPARAITPATAWICRG